MLDTLIIPRASTQELYNAALGAALHAPFIWDTDEILQNDPSAYEKMRNDTVIAHLVQQRKHEVAGLEWFLEPASQHPDDKRLAKALETLLKSVANFPTARFNLAEAILRGSAWSGIRGGFRRMSVADLPAERWWVVSELVDMDKRRFRQQHVEDPGDPSPRFEWFLKRPYAQEWVELHREWYVHHTYGEEESSLHFGKGLSKALSYYWWLKTETLKLATKYLDRWALGLLSAKVALDPGARRDPVNSTRVQSWLKSLKAMREGYALVYDKEDEIELKEASGVGFDAISSMLGYYDGSMRVLLLGSSLPTAPDAQGGSYAMAKVQAAKSRSLIRFDRALLEETITRDVVAFLMRANWATIARIGLRPTGVPQFRIRDEEQDDPIQRAQVIQTALQIGLPVRVEDVYTQLQLTPPTSGDKVLNGLQGGNPLSDALQAFTDKAQGGSTKPPAKANAGGLPSAQPSVTDVLKRLHAVAPAGGELTHGEEGSSMGQDGEVSFKVRLPAPVVRNEITTPAPVVNNTVTTPAPVVRVTTPTPVVRNVVNVKTQAPRVLNVVQAPQAPPAQVVLQGDKRPKELVVERDGEGRIVGAVVRPKDPTQDTE